MSGYSSEAAAIIDFNLSLFIVHLEHFAHTELKHYVPKKKKMQIEVFLIVVHRL